MLFYVDYFLMFSSSKDKIDTIYASLQADFNIEDDVYLNNYLGIELDHRPDVSMYIRQPYIFQWIINLIPCMDKPSNNTNHAIKPPIEKYQVSQQRKITLITGQ